VDYEMHSRHDTPLDVGPPSDEPRAERNDSLVEADACVTLPSGGDPDTFPPAMGAEGKVTMTAAGRVYRVETGSNGAAAKNGPAEYVLDDARVDRVRGGAELSARELAAPFLALIERSDQERARALQGFGRIAARRRSLYQNPDQRARR
jgi:hypothetical protein